MVELRAQLAAALVELSAARRAPYPNPISIAMEHVERALEIADHGKDATALLRYLWDEAEVELRPLAGNKVRDAFAENDPLAEDIRAVLHL